MKICAKCKQTKDLALFYKNNAYKTGVQSFCKECTILDSTNWRKNNPDKVKLIASKWVKQNLSKHSAKSAKRHAAKLKRTPPWLTSEHYKEIESFYFKSFVKTNETRSPYEVDHIIPLQGENVSGLHVPWNLQILTKKDNSSKGNR